MDCDNSECKKKIDVTQEYVKWDGMVFCEFECAKAVAMGLFENQVTYVEPDPEIPPPTGKADCMGDCTQCELGDPKQKTLQEPVCPQRKPKSK